MPCKDCQQPLFKEEYPLERCYRCARAFADRWRRFFRGKWTY